MRRTVGDWKKGEWIYFLVVAGIAIILYLIFGD